MNIHYEILVCPNDNPAVSILARISVLMKATTTTIISSRWLMSWIITKNFYDIDEKGLIFF